MALCVAPDCLFCISTVARGGIGWAPCMRTPTTNQAVSDLARTRELMRGTRVLFPWILVSVVLGGCQGEARTAETTNRTGSGSAVDQIACERALATQPGARVQPLAERIAPRWSVRSAEPLTWIAGLDWEPEEHQLVVLDIMSEQVVVMDTLGHTRLKFGRKGPGPGEFDFASPMGGPGRNRLVAFPGGFVVSDGRGVHWFNPYGKYEGTLEKYRSELAASFDVHMAWADDRLLLSESGRGAVWSSDWDVRSRLSVAARVPDREGPWAGVFTFRNSWWDVPDGEIGFHFLHRPYSGIFRRTWDANGNLAVALADERYGVCFFDFTPRLLSAYALALQSKKVDRAERERELRRLAGGDPDAPLPFLGISERQRLKGRWPEYAPRYVDVVMGTDSTAWALRWDGDTTVADLYDLRVGYLGSIKAYHDRLPRIIRDSVAWYVAPDSMGVPIFIGTSTRSAATALRGR